MNNTPYDVAFLNAVAKLAEVAQAHADAHDATVSDQRLVELAGLYCDDDLPSIPKLRAATSRRLRAAIAAVKGSAQ